MRVAVITGALAIAATAALSAAAAAPRPSNDPYQAGLAFAACMRAQGVPHPERMHTGTGAANSGSRRTSAGETMSFWSCSIGFHFSSAWMAGGRKSAELQGYTLTPTGAWSAFFAPFAFDSDPARFTLARKVLRKTNGDPEDRRRELTTAEVEVLRVELRSQPATESPLPPAD
jgi:hypothetical protein